VSPATNVGFDLDLTLVDTRRATQAAAARINEILGVSIDLDVFVASIGLPIREQLARWVPEPHLNDAVSQFRAIIGHGDHAPR
jgi:phosphoglycolate phosphatase